jgi:predicted NBD/HSP70 family sugar kinase/DNA-binding transcriptional ArsR family regulator
MTTTRTPIGARPLAPGTEQDPFDGVSGEVVAAVLTSLIRGRREGLTRTDLCERLMLTRPTVGRAVRALDEQGFIDVEHEVHGRRGRPAERLMLCRSSWVCIGIHIKDTGPQGVEVEGTLTDLYGHSVLPAPLVRRRSWQNKTGPGHGAELLSLVAKLADELNKSSRAAGQRVLGVGVQLGGHVDSGKVRKTASVKMGAVDLQAELAARLGLPVVVENDMTARVIREHLYGDLWRKADTYALIGLFASGVGAGLVVGGQVWRGATGLAGEVGHSPIRALPEGAQPKCRCGHDDCLEQVVTLTALQAIHDAGAANGRATQALEQAGEVFGDALVTLRHWVDVGVILVQMPEALLEFDPDTAFFLAALERLKARTFSGSSSCQLTNIYRTDKGDEHQHTKAAAASVVYGYLEQLRAGGGLTECTDGVA